MRRKGRSETFSWLTNAIEKNENHFVASLLRKKLDKFCFIQLLLMHSSHSNEHFLEENVSFSAMSVVTMDSGRGRTMKHKTFHIIRSFVRCSFELKLKKKWEKTEGGSCLCPMNRNNCTKEINQIYTLFTLFWQRKTFSTTFFVFFFCVRIETKAKAREQTENIFNIFFFAFSLHWLIS